jgi:hypothetical protein
LLGFVEAMKIISPLALPLLKGRHGRVVLTGVLSATQSE